MDNKPRKHRIERLTDSYRLGEGPHWDEATQCLYFVDCTGLDILKYNPQTNKVTKASVAPKIASFIIPIEGQKNRFIVSLNKELVIISWDGESEKFTVVENLCVADDSPETADNKFNDGKCDSSGRLWTGTHNLNTEDITKTLPVGTLYSFDSNRQLKNHANQIRLSNGIAFNEETKKMFYIDSLEGSIDQFDFDVTSGTITNRQIWFTFAKNNLPGGPDGMTIDTDGNLWVACCGGGRVAKVDGHKPETLLYTIEMPAEQITSVAFGGASLNDLYVTSANFQDDLPKPANGALYRVTLEERGHPCNNFKLD